MAIEQHGDKKSALPFPLYVSREDYVKFLRTELREHPHDGRLQLVMLNQIDPNDSTICNIVFLARTGEKGLPICAYLERYRMSPTPEHLPKWTENERSSFLALYRRTGLVSIAAREVIEVELELGRTCDVVTQEGIVLTSEKLHQRQFDKNIWRRTTSQG